MAFHPLKTVFALWDEPKEKVYSAHANTKDPDQPTKLHITKTLLFKYIEISRTQKTESFSIKILICFLFLLKT